MAAIDTAGQARVDGMSPALRSPVAWVVLALLLLMPLIVSRFLLFQVGGYALILGIIGLSLMVLAGYGGMVSLAQMSVAGLAGYMVAILGDNSLGTGLGWPWWLVVLGALVVAVAFSVIVGLLAVRTAGIYTIMITLAIGMSLYLFAQQNYTFFNGHSGFAAIAAPVAFGVDWHQPVPFYYLALAVAGLCFAAVSYVARAPFGLALQATRDNARRMRALGFNVAAHRIAAYAGAGIIAGLGGVLLAWFDGRMSPGTIGVDRLIDILVIAVLGGIRHPAGPFLGALVFVLLDNFASNLIGAERFNTLIGVCFLAIVLFSADGLIGLIERGRRFLARRGGLGQ